MANTLQWITAGFGMDRSETPFTNTTNAVVAGLPPQKVDNPAPAPDIDGDAAPSGPAFPDTCEDEFSNVIEIPPPDFILVENCDILEPPDPIYESNIYTNHFSSGGGHTTATKTGNSGLMPVNFFFTLYNNVTGASSPYLDVGKVYTIRTSMVGSPHTAPLLKSKAVWATLNAYDARPESGIAAVGLAANTQATVTIKQGTQADVMADAYVDTWVDVGTLTIFGLGGNSIVGDWRNQGAAIDIAQGNVLGGHLIPGNLGGGIWTNSQYLIFNVCVYLSILE